MKNEIYRLWYEYLTRSNRTDWIKKVRGDFTDITDGFDAWWAANEHLFEPQCDRFLVNRLSVDQDLSDYKGSEDMVMIVEVNLLETKANLIKGFEALLIAEHPGKPGKPKYDDFCEYTLRAHPDAPTVKALQTTLHVYDACKERGEKTLWEVGDECGLIPDYSVKKPKVGADKTECMHRLEAEVCRHLREAEMILKNVARGDFPVRRVVYTSDDRLMQLGYL